MSAEWPTVRLGDLIEASLGKMLDKEKNKGSEKPYLGNSNVRWGCFDLTNLSEMRFEDNESARYGIKRGDLIVCEGGEPGRCAIWTEDVMDMRIQKALHRIRTKSALNNYYLYYWFLFSGTRGLLDPFFTGTTIKHLTGKALKDLEIQLPPIEYQESVADILNSIDDKIALNRRTNQTLEQIAQAIFKNWFVDFEPTRAKIAAKKRWLALNEIVETSSPTCYSHEFDTDKPNTQSLDEAMTQAAMAAISGKTPEELARLSDEQQQHLRGVAALFPDTLVDSELGEIPEGWTVMSLDKIAHYQNGLALQKFRPEREDLFLPVLKIAQLKRGFTDSDEKASPNIKPECIVDNGDVIFSWSGSLVVDVCGVFQGS